MSRSTWNTSSKERTRSIATGAEERVPNGKENRWRTQLSMTYNLQHELPRRGADTHRKQQRPSARQDAENPRGATFGHLLPPLSILLGTATGDMFCLINASNAHSLGLAAALFIGMLVAASDWYRPSHSEEFSVVPRAVAPPPPLAVGSSRAGAALAQFGYGRRVSRAAGNRPQKLPSGDSSPFAASAVLSSGWSN